jgi:hypothetical protein
MPSDADVFFHSSGSFMRRCFLVAVLLTIAVEGGNAQKTTRTPGFVREKFVTIFAGFSFPLGRGGFLEYWQPGPAAGIEFSTRVSRYFSLGLGVNAAAHWFRAGKFGNDHPGVPVLNLPVAHIGVELIGRLDLLPAKRVNPYFGFSLGAVRMSGATYTASINAVRVVYYDLPVRTRLMFGVNPGVEFRLGRSVALDVEGKFLYVNNDPNVSWTVAPRAGIRFIL